MWPDINLTACLAKVLAGVSRERIANVDTLDILESTKFRALQGRTYVFG